MFDPDRFLPEREHELTPGAYLPFGMGPRTCVGAGFAQTEASLIIARLTRRFELSTLEPEKVRPVARLTTRPVQQIHCRRVIPSDIEGRRLAETHAGEDRPAQNLVGGDRHQQKRQRIASVPGDVPTAKQVSEIRPPGASLEGCPLCLGQCRIELL